MWTAIRFVHVLSAITWVGIHLTLFALFPVLRRRLEPDAFRIALTSHEGRTRAEPGWPRSS